MKKRLMKSLLIGSLIVSGFLFTGCQSEKKANTTVSSLKVGEMKSLEKEKKANPYTALLGSNVGGLAFNAPDKVEALTVYFDVYEKDKLIRHEEAGSVLFDDEDDLGNRKGSLVWGQYEGETGNDNDNQHLEPLSVAYTTDDGGVSINFGMPDVTKYTYDMSSSSVLDKAEKIPLNEPVMLSVWGKGESMSTYSDGKEYFKKKNLTPEASYFLYAIFSDKVVE